MYDKLLKELIEKSGKSLRQVGREAGVSHTYISKLMSGEKPPPSDEVSRALALAVDGDPEELIFVGHLEKVPEPVRKALKLQSPLYWISLREAMDIPWEELLAFLQRYGDPLDHVREEREKIRAIWPEKPTVQELLKHEDFKQYDGFPEDEVQEIIDVAFGDIDIGHWLSRLAEEPSLIGPEVREEAINKLPEPYKDAVRKAQKVEKRLLSLRLSGSPEVARIAEELTLLFRENFNFGLIEEERIQLARDIDDHWSKLNQAIIQKSTPGRVAESRAPYGLPIKQVPLIGRPAAGRPLISEQNFEGYVPAPEGLDCDFAVRVSGDSMEGAGYRDSDIAYCIKAERRQPQSGDMVVALLNGGEATIKWLLHAEDGTWFLRAANAKYRDISLKGPDDRVQAVVVGSLRGKPRYPGMEFEQAAAKE